MNTRIPLIAGIAPRVGTSTLAAALHAEDGGMLGQHADVVVCGSIAESLQAAAAVICPGRGPRPVLAVVGPRVVAQPPMLRTLFSAVVEIPRVQRWDGRDTPVGEASEVLAEEPDLLDPPLRPYSAALRAVVAALVGSGQLAAGGPPMVIRPRPAEPWRAAPAAMPAAMPAGAPAGVPAGMPADAPARMPAGAPARMPAGMPDGVPAGVPAGAPAGMPAGVPAAPGRHRRRPEILIVDRPPPRVGYAGRDDDAIEAATLAAERRASRPGPLAV